MSRLATVVLVALAASVVAAPVPVVKKGQWLISMNDDLYLFTEGDEKPTKLTDGKGQYDDADWSADGKRIAFCSKKDGYSHICTADADGKNVVQLTQGPQKLYGPNWSSDGKRIAFYREVGDNRKMCQICAVSSKDGTDLEVLSDSDDYNPVFSPDGKTIAFISQRGDGYELYTMGANGKNQTRLVSEPVASIAIVPAWSPAGKQIACTLRKGKGFELHLVNADGTGATTLTQFGEHKIARSPSWSPNGKRVSFVLDDFSEGTANPCSLWVIDANGENQKELLRLGTDASRLLTKALWRPK